MQSAKGTAIERLFEAEFEFPMDPLDLFEGTKSPQFISNWLGRSLLYWALMLSLNPQVIEGPPGLN